MSRWVERARAGLAVLVVPAALLLGPPSAAALPQELVTPSPFPEPDTLPVQPLAGAAVPLLPVEQDRGRVARREQTTTGSAWRLDANLAFAKDSAVLLPAARARLSQLRAELATATPSAVTITGHTDDLGSAEHGLELSRRRAQAVQQALGPALTRHRVVVLGRGEADPLVPNTSEANRRLNRRVEVGVRAVPVTGGRR